MGPYCMPTATADTKDEIPSLGILIGTYQLGKDWKYKQANQRQTFSFN